MTIHEAAELNVCDCVETMLCIILSSMLHMYSCTAENIASFQMMDLCMVLWMLMTVSFALLLLEVVSKYVIPKLHTSCPQEPPIEEKEPVIVLGHLTRFLIAE